jgi:hypothetical protein
MIKRIVTPTIIEDPLATVQLKYTEASIKQSALKFARPEPIDKVIEGFISSPGPLITIGRPEWWHLTPQARQYLRTSPPKSAAAESLTRYLHETDLHLLMVACAFTADVERHILEVRFTVFLRPQVGKSHPVVLDLFPRDVLYAEDPEYVERAHVTSALRFEKGTLPPEEDLLTVEMKNILPVIQASQADSSAPLWTYKTKQAEGLVDARFGYMIIAKPRQAKSVIMQMDIRADVRTPHGCFTAGVKEKDKAVLTHTVCKEWIEV